MKREHTNNEHHRLLAVSEPAKITMFSAVNPRDGYEPIDEDSANLIKHRRNVKRGTAIIALAALLAVSAVGVVHVTEKNSNYSKSKSNGSTNKEAAQGMDTDVLFSYMLMDEKGYFFPTTLGSLKEGNVDAAQPNNRRSRRLLEANENDLPPPPQMNWSWDWKHDKEAGAAVAEYYRAKGMALADYYRSKYDPTYNQNVNSPSIPASDTTAPSAGTDTTLDTNPTTSNSVWTYDWQADQDRGLAIGETYKAIGESIEDHYRKAYDPTYQASPTAANVRSVSSPSSTYYDWQADQERGLAIGEYYKNLGRKIQEHYDGDSYQRYIAAKVGQDDDAKTMWEDFKQKGMEIGQYYHQKGLAIGDYYRNRAQWGTSPAAISAALSLDVVADPVATAAVTTVPPPATASPAGEINPANPAQAAAASAPAAAASAEVAAKNANLRGEAAVTSVLTPTTEDPAPVASTATPPTTAQQIIDDMRRKGEAIGDYYRSKYDPTYHQNLGGTAAVASPLDDEQVWPAWGKNSEADRAHGQAIGNYYRAKYDPTFQQQNAADQQDVDVAPSNVDGQEIGQFYEHKGKELGQYYQSKGMSIGNAYRSKYDPTFQAPPQSLDVPPQDVNAPAVEKPLKEDWPAWGVDSDADKAHGAAIHEYYKQRGMEERRHQKHHDHHEHHDHHHDKDQREDKEDNEEEQEQDENSIQDFYREQGKEIRDFYRSKYDPTYRPAVVVPPTDEQKDAKNKDGYVVDFDDDSAEATATATVAPQDAVAASPAPAMTKPSWAPWMGDGKPRNEDWPAWGVNPEADRAHGKAIGAYYKKRGKDVGRHYENYYRTMFDPSYRGAQRDINW